MKTAILCALFLIVGAVAGSAITGYLVNSVHERQNAILLAGDLGSAALQAELIKQGEVEIVLGTLERGIPIQVLAVDQKSVRDRTYLADSSIEAAKRFYVCTDTAIPAEISDIMQGVALPADACGASK
jgi:D-alanine-D-alanine ligase-like ATP-grasp enzyme